MLFPRRSAQPVENSQLCLFYFFFGTNDDSPFYSLYFLRFAENSSKKNYPKNNSTYCFRRIVFDQLFSTNCYSTNRFSINCFSPNFLSTNYLSNNSFSPNFFSTYYLSKKSFSANSFSNNCFCEKLSANDFSQLSLGAFETKKRRDAARNLALTSLLQILIFN